MSGPLHFQKKFYSHYQYFVGLFNSFLSTYLSLLKLINPLKLSWLYLDEKTADPKNCSNNAKPWLFQGAATLALLLQRRVAQLDEYGTISASVRDKVNKADRRKKLYEAKLKEYREFLAENPDDDDM
jgi:hypothetical protein